MAVALPFPDQDRARFNAAWQHDLPARLGSVCLDQLVEQSLRRAGEATVGVFLNSMRDAPSQKVRPKCGRRVGPKHLPVPDPQLSDRHGRQPVQLGLDDRIGWLTRRVCRRGHYRARSVLTIR